MSKIIKTEKIIKGCFGCPHSNIYSMYPGGYEFFCGALRDSDTKAKGWNQSRLIPHHSWDYSRSIPMQPVDRKTFIHADCPLDNYVDDYEGVLYE